MNMTAEPNANFFLEVLPPALKEAIRRISFEEILEVVLDVGRRPLVRILERTIELACDPIGYQVIDDVVARLSDIGPDNRAGIEGSLHRISAIRNRRGRIVGLTMRVGRALPGSVDLIRDLVESGSSILLLGRPGIGKTTKLRGIAPVLANELQKRVIIIDTSNEIAGDGDVPHPAIGSARRMQVPHPDRQHGTMIEAVENHMPEVIIVDEIGT